MNDEPHLKLERETGSQLVLSPTRSFDPHDLLHPGERLALLNLEEDPVQVGRVGDLRG